MFDDNLFVDNLFVDLKHTWGNNDNNVGGFILFWHCKESGWGEIAFTKPYGDGPIECVNEGVSRAFVARVIDKFLDDCVMEEEIE